ncbi:hypothetical protein BDP27DRAFT_1324989 [Rhodocollybia butyracea]|uniref:Uncharacterized protein n=1 Tax=Rhodocollybia butyracea TaxID=206335 RepID=A0A9P5U893_9AGAR|nr:hypothetical protein BDP27DRAFT_1324989 [Rhodocollybia butyracea]
MVRKETEQFTYVKSSTNPNQHHEEQPMSSPTSPTTPRRRLSSRRGSISAPDPFAKHAEINLNPNRLSSSTLTIVRVPNANSDSLSHAHSAFANANPGTISLKDPPGPGQRRPHHWTFRETRTSIWRPRKPRMSFAFSTFGSSRPSPSDRTGARTPSPSSPSRLRPSSPGSGYAAPKPKLTPEQLYDLAHNATNLTSSQNQRAYPFLGSPRSSPLSSIQGVSSGAEPATFTPLHPSVYLPFIDRPAEVKALIESTPTRKLFALLKQTFPRGNYSDSAAAPITSARLVVTNADPNQSPPVSPVLSDPNPTTWTYDGLISYLTTTPRENAPDALWIAKIRKCILSRSELIWERVKGALGVPPELDVDFDLDMDMDADVFESSESESESDRDMQSPLSVKTPKTDEMEDGGMKARGYWEGWDAIVDSPVYDRSAFPSANSASPSADEPMPINAAAAMVRTRHSYSSEDTTDSLTPVQKESRSPSRADTEVPEIRQQMPTPTTMSFDDGQQANAASQDGNMSAAKHRKSTSRSSWGSQGSFSASSISSPNPETGVIIEPLIISPNQGIVGSSGLNPPPLSLPASLADSVNPGKEEDDAGKAKEESKEDVTTTNSPNPTIDPVQIHGLRISLPSSPGSSAASSPVLSYRPFSHNPIPGSLSRTNSLTQTESKRSSWGSIGSGVNLYRTQSLGLTRTGSSGSITSIGSQGLMGYSSDYSSRGFAGGTGEGGSGYDSEGGYDPVGDRSPGNPLFPSNFARLATGPTLQANNPSLRSPSLPPQSKYPHVLYGRKNRIDRRGSNTSGVSGTSNDYALTLGSGSSHVAESTG